MKPSLSIVVPIYNRARIVGRTLDSIAASSRAFSELIIVDNASTDDSMQVCTQWASSHPDIRSTVLVEQHPGASAARNRGLLECHTEYIYFFDSDDLFDAGAVAAILDNITGWDMLFLPSRQEVNGHLSTRAYTPSASPHVQILNSMFSTINMAFRTSWLRDIGGWNEGLSTWDDWELGLRCMLSRPRIQWLTGRAFHHVIVHPESQTGTDFTSTLSPILHAMAITLQDIEASTLSEEVLRKCRLAMYARARIMAGKLRKEGNRGGSESLLQIASQALPRPTWLQKTSGTLLENYTAIGGRGAWRIALCLLGK